MKTDDPNMERNMPNIENNNMPNLERRTPNTDSSMPNLERNIPNLDNNVNKENFEKQADTVLYCSDTKNGLINSSYSYQSQKLSSHINNISSIRRSPSYDRIMSPSKTSESINFSSSDECDRQIEYSMGNLEKNPTFVVTRSINENIDHNPIIVGNNKRVSSSSPPLSSPKASPPLTSSTEDKHVWTKQEVELLLDLYESFKDQLKDPRVRKTKIWEDIAQIIRNKLESDVNGSQCNQKFRNLKADFQKVVEHNGRPGTFKRVCKYYERLANILNYPRPPMSSGYIVPHIKYPKVELCEKTEVPRQHSNHNNEEIYFQNGNPPQKISKKRKSHESIPMEGVYNNNNNNYYPSKKHHKPCNCEYSSDITTLRDTIERINNYIVSRDAHEEERIRRLEERHREKLLAVNRFLDIFKDFILKLS